MDRPWVRYRATVLALLERFRGDESPQSLKDAEAILEAMDEYRDRVPIHWALVDILYETPTLRVLDGLRNDDHLEDHALDQLIDAVT